MSAVPIPVSICSSLIAGLSSAYKGLLEGITFLMHRFTDCIGFGGTEIDGLVADCTILGLSGLGHNDASRGVLICPMIPETSVEKMVNLEQLSGCELEIIPKVRPGAKKGLR